MTKTPTAPWRIGRSVGAFFAGVLATVVPSEATDAVLHALAVYPPVGVRMTDAQFALALAYRIVYGIAGGWTTARLAPYRPMQHALACGALGFVLTSIGAAVNWEKMDALGPKWYSLALIATTFPCAWIGAKLAQSKKRA